MFRDEPIVGMVQPAEIRPVEDVRQEQWPDVSAVKAEEPITADDVEAGIWWYHKYVWLAENPREFTERAKRGMAEISTSGSWIALLFGGLMVVPLAVWLFIQWVAGNMEHTRKWRELIRNPPKTYVEKWAERKDEAGRVS